GSVTTDVDCCADSSLSATEADSPLMGSTTLVVFSTTSSTFSIRPPTSPSSAEAMEPNAPRIAAPETVSVPRNTHRNERRTPSVWCRSELRRIPGSPTLPDAGHVTHVTGLCNTLGPNRESAAPINVGFPVRNACELAEILGSSAGELLTK